jgi:D-alanine-D-alanine ligase
MNKCVVIWYNEIMPGAKEDELDVLEQVNIVKDALTELGYTAHTCSVSLDLTESINFIKKHNPDFVFNLVETIHFTGELLYFAPAILNFLHIPYTGAPLEGMFLTTNKLLAKNFMQLHGIPVSESIELTDLSPLQKDKQYIIKPQWEDGSLGIHEECVFWGHDQQYIEKLASYSPKKYFIEPYIDGREYNISIMGGADVPEILPIAEMTFVNYPEDKPKILSYKSKWTEGAFEFENTVRTFDFQKQDHELREKLAAIARRCWDVFGLKGYGRVDYRVDKEGKPFVLEVNANPCIAEHSGFNVAAHQAGYTFPQIIERIILDAVK